MNKSALEAIEPAENAASTTALDTLEIRDIEYVSNLLEGRYRILRLLARGEDSSHYLARAAEHDRLVNLEVLSAQATRDGRKVDLFCLQADAAAGLSHKNIFSVSRVHQIKSAYFTVSPHDAELETLRGLLDRKSVLDVSQAVKFARNITAALDYAHRLGVLHLQLHPENILLGADETALVRGFGVSARDEFEYVHKERSYRCPVQYRSPEQMSGAGIDHLSDLYCLGILLFEMLTDRVPFNSTDPEYIKRKRIAQTPWPPHTLCGTVPEDLSNLVVELLKNDPDERIQSGAKFLSALDDLFSLGKAVEAEPPIAAPIEIQQGIDGQSPCLTRLVVVEPAETESPEFTSPLPASQPPSAATVDASHEELGPNVIAVENAEEPRNARAGIYGQSTEVVRTPPLSDAEPKYFAVTSSGKSTSRRRAAFIVASLFCLAVFTVFAYRGGLLNATKTARGATSVIESAAEPAPVLETPAASESPATTRFTGETDDLRQVRKKTEYRPGSRMAASSKPEDKSESPEETKPSSTLLVVPLANSKSGAITVNDDRNRGALIVGGAKTNDEMRKTAEKKETANRATSVSNVDRKGLPSQKQKDNSNLNPR